MVDGTPDRNQERLDEIVRYHTAEGGPFVEFVPTPEPRPAMTPLFKVYMSEDAPSQVGRVLQSGFIGQGPVVDVFEKELMNLVDGPIVLTNSCTSAIAMVLTHLGVGPGDEVITTPLTCIATNSPIVALGARPVWADIDSLTGNINPLDVARKITPRTKAIIAVNWTGRTAEYRELKALGLPVIEDAAHGPMTARAREDRGDYICYSFGPIKHLTTGDGGGVVTFNPSDREALRLLRWYGLDRQSTKDFRCAQDIIYPGQKWHMTDINAAIGRANLPHLMENIRLHKENAFRLYTGIRNSMLRQPLFSKDSNYWVFPLHVELDGRDKFKDYLAANGIEAGQVHARNDKHTGYNFPNGMLSGVGNFSRTHINIPCGWWVSPAEIERIIAVINKWGGN